MLLYSVQEAKYFKNYQSDPKVLDGKVICIEEFRKPYQWLIKELNKKNKNFKKDKYPVWAWKDKPDLRSYKYTCSKSKKYVLLTLDVPDDEVVFSGFNYWHFVLSGKFLNTTDKEDKAFDKKHNSDWHDYWKDWVEIKENNLFKRKKIPKKMKEEIEKSWQKIFDLNFLKKEKDDLQANIPSIKAEYIIKIVEFKGASKY